eukprot:CAMPEP_0116895762 /NCGR_PEP_ID=MMETSP0467-20121206/5192_1 /TAXON_ID=283647 /ORGANISM="Mesodinium pulex, Strain SPMC105" /LENGTH=60 /DNA_ID=CAMNT_0004566629 /DNA_START=527 /DNA_END=709 /DNA_ORIENTATION=+
MNNSNSNSLSKDHKDKKYYDHRLGYQSHSQNFNQQHAMNLNSNTGNTNMNQLNMNHEQFQ